MASECRRKRVAVVGGGMSGLVAGRHLADPAWGLDFTLFEQTGSLGGTWVYSEWIGEDEFGLPVHSSMYRSLRTNLPKECMMFPDFPHTKQGVSYLSAAEMLQYLESYADHFNIRPYVKFRHYVKEIKPEGSKWKVHVRDLKNQQDHHYVFDAVILGTGHYSKPRCALLPGLEHFQGRVLHSHDYREPSPFRDQRVLIVGAATSGLDVTFDLSTVTDHVTLSHHSEHAAKVAFPPKVVHKPDVDRIDEEGVVLFKDGSRAEFEVIVLCTGYQYTFPFLSEECGLTIEDNYVSPLHLNIVNINHPTMGLIGLIRDTLIFYVADLQVRFFLKTFLNPELLPSKEEMLSQLHKEEKILRENNITKSNFFLIRERSQKYIDDICRVSGATPVPPIFLRIFFHSFEQIFSDFTNFRYNFYEIIDQEKFTVVNLRKIKAKPV